MTFIHGLSIFGGPENVIAWRRRSVSYFSSSSIVYISLVKIHHEVVDEPELVLITIEFSSVPKELFSHMIAVEKIRSSLRKRVSFFLCLGTVRDDEVKNV